MKIFTIILLLFTNTVAAADILTCPRAEKHLADIVELAQDPTKALCSGRFSEGASELFESETNLYRDENLTPLLQDNVHDMSWLIRKATQDRREHTFCFELLCQTIQSFCTFYTQTYSVEKEQANWCETRTREFEKIERIKIEQVLIENQQRKSRSNLREKMRSLEVRMSNLFLPLAQKFFAEYRWFTEKVPTFIANPI